MCRVQALEFDVGVGGGEAPVEPLGDGVTRGHPSGEIARHRRRVA